MTRALSVLVDPASNLVDCTPFRTKLFPSACAARHLAVERKTRRGDTVSAVHPTCAKCTVGADRARELDTVATQHDRGAMGEVMRTSKRAPKPKGKAGRPRVNTTCAHCGERAVAHGMCVSLYRKSLRANARVEQGQ